MPSTYPFTNLIVTIIMATFRVSYSTPIVTIIMVSFRVSGSGFRAWGFWLMVWESIETALFLVNSAAASTKAFG